MKQLKIAVLGFVGIAALSAAVPLTALAAHSPNAKGGNHGRRGPGLVFGTVASVGTSSFDVTTASGSVTVNTTSKTKLAANNAAAAAAGFKSGDAVLATGWFRNGFTARSVTYDVAPFALRGKGHTFVGSFSSAPAGQVVITNKKGTETFNVDASTQYRQNGKKVTTPVYAAGDRLAVWAREYTDGSWLARSVSIHAPKTNKGGHKH